MLASDRSFVQTIKTFPTNTEVKTVKTFNTTPASPSPFGGGQTGANFPAASDAGAITLEMNTSFIVLPNPFIKATQEDWELQQNMLASISSYINEIHTSVNKLRKVKKQLEYYNEMLANVPKANLIKEAASSIISTMDAWESAIVESRTKNGQDVINWPSKLNVEFFYLKGLVDISDPVITEGVKNKLKDLKATWTSEKLKFDTILESVNNFNNQFKNADLPALQF